MLALPPCTKQHLCLGPTSVTCASIISQIHVPPSQTLCAYVMPHTLLPCLSYLCCEPAVPCQLLCMRLGHPVCAEVQGYFQFLWTWQQFYLPLTKGLQPLHDGRCTQFELTQNKGFGRNFFTFYSLWISCATPMNFF